MIDWLPYAGIAAAALAAPPALARLQLSLAKHPSLTGHGRMAKRLAAWLPAVHYDEARFFAADSAPPAVVAQRRAGFDGLVDRLGDGAPNTVALTRATREGLSDLQFTGRYRVPFQFSRYLGARLTLGAFVAAADGVELVDLDGNRRYDLTGSYGVNLFGHDFYRACMAEAQREAAAHGAVLGAYHPCVADNVARLRRISGLDEVSFHMSGTEAVMQAVRLARYHTGRRRLVRFSGAYHGWWGDVQPGPGNPLQPNDTLTLAELSARSLRVLEQRSDVACVLVNPLQAMHPNAAAPGDSALVDGSRRAGVDRAAYTRWLAALRSVCSARGIVLILDEVFVGFRLARGGAQEYFDVRADLVTYGKTLGGGLPVGVLCGRADLMKRYREDHPADICFARGTFNAHPMVMAAMHAFLTRLDTPAIAALYDGLDTRWNERAALLNRRLAEAGVPVRVANLSSIFTVLYTRASRYHWMLQFYLRDAGLALPWTGSGRLIFSLDYDDSRFAAVVERFVAAAQAMQADGWWWTSPELTAKRIRRDLLREFLVARFGRRRPTAPLAQHPTPTDA
jgi:glutamate-1-semialdehyde 2,1-aminomutase